MSTFGGDSWVPENLYRKRRVAELLGEEIEVDEVKLLSNGKLACLVCPTRPVLDTMPMLHVSWLSRFALFSFLFILNSPIFCRCKSNSIRVPFLAFVVSIRFH
jgi:hypothetical protein